MEPQVSLPFLRHWKLSPARWIQTSFLHTIYLKYIFMSFHRNLTHQYNDRGSNHLRNVDLTFSENTRRNIPEDSDVI
jgi:hypothetical protein